MLLRDLSRTEQELFLELCNYLAGADDDHSPLEEKHITEYRREMDLDSAEYGLHGLAYEDIVDGLKKAARLENVRRIMIEAAALVRADGVVDGREQGILERLQQDLGVAEAFMQQVPQVLDELARVYARIYRLVDADS